MKSGGIFEWDALINNISVLQEKTTHPDFWIDQKKAQNVLRKISILTAEKKMWETLDDLFSEVEIHFEIIDSGDEPDKDFTSSFAKFDKYLSQVEVKLMMNEPDDSKNAIITIHPGAGGTESQDWANMLYRLYTRWCENNSYKTKIIDFQPGDEAGLKDVTIEVIGDFAYGNLKSEAGVHRLVRISPFDSNSRRHTSFASVFIYPILDDDVDIEIDDKDIRIDTYRASGAGGQHVNKTDSAIRITHLPSNTVVQCQNERSQLKNKNVAMKMLKAKLYKLRLDEQKKEKQHLEDQKMEIAWGSQIRSYVFHPYNLVKDHRTKVEMGNIQAVMDGDIDQFIRGYLLFNMEK
jgi:peptide chain release factor 2